MSYYGRQCLLEIERLELKAEFQWWDRYANRLTPDERSRLRNGNYSALKRPVQPSFRKGQRIEPIRGLTIEIASVEVARRGGYLVRLGRIEDFRSRAALSRRISSDPDLVTTLNLVDRGSPQGEPGRIDKEAEDRFTKDARARFKAHLLTERAA